jgi:A/G-specific adenine glycosylase
MGRKNYRQRKSWQRRPGPIPPGTIARVIRKAKFISATLEAYASQTSRDFAWRRPGLSPFHILLAEVLLRQTRAEAAAPVWDQLRGHYVTPADLLAAPFDELYGFVAPLGLGIQRVRVLQGIASALVDQGEVVPETVPELLAIPYIGPYIAHAVACFAYGQREPIVDSNVLRLFGRLYGETFTGDNREEPRAWSYASISVLASSSPRVHNWAMLDFTAEICRARGPRCPICPLRPECVFGQATALGD